MRMDEQAASRLVDDASRIVGFTGAGISTESGIPDFRGSTGALTDLPDRIPTLQQFVSSVESRIDFWGLGVDLWSAIGDARPNAGHDAFVELHRQGRLEALITQNVDRLHQRAGLPGSRVLELHGTATEALCLNCGGAVPADEIRRRIENGEQAPCCRPCGGLLKSAVILFGEVLPEDVVRRAEAAARACDLLLVVGSSLMVEPAASLPWLARDAGARVVVINRDPTPLDDVADVVLRGEIGVLLPRLVSPGG